MTIPPFLYGEEYLQNPIMRRFLRDHHINLVDSRAEYIKAIEDYANQNEENEQEVHEWLIKVVKEGTKEFCYKKIYDIAEWQRNPILLEKKISEQFSNCPKKDILSYHNTGMRTMIDYKFTLNKNGNVSKIDFSFSSLFMYGNAGEVGNKTVFPVFIEVYLDEGFIVSREKAKSTLYKYDEENPILIGQYKIDTMEYAISIIKEIVEKLEFHTEGNPKAVKSNVFQMLYRIYDEYAFTPKDIVEKVDSVKGIVNRFIDDFFSELQLNVRNKEKAINDANILVEKFISIDGNNEKVFREDRPAYLIKITADDEMDLTKIDALSIRQNPLQCTEAFFDSKRSVTKSKQCKQLKLVFKRNDTRYFPTTNQLEVFLGVSKNNGCIKTLQYAEEVDIQNVLQTVFRNY